MKRLLVLVVTATLLSLPGALLFNYSNNARVVACHNLPNAPC